ncbi:MAG: antibiotic biosynthesis monooxygenase [Proteiniphilum sp.]|jgi:quinol monooxygenase YgiN|nr:antibiotic biosynthesis monooxygenase [Proteiniphilum sp.]
MKKVEFILFALALTGLLSCGGKKCEENSQCAAKTPVETKQPEKEKKVVVARLVVKEGQEKAFIEIAAKLVNATREETGNLYYSVYQSPLKGTEFLFYEEYKDEAAFKEHSSSEHFAAFAEAIKDLTAGDLIVDEF